MKNIPRIHTEFSISRDFISNPLPNLERNSGYCFFSANTGEGEIIKKRYDRCAVMIRDYDELRGLTIRGCGINYWSDCWVNEKGEVIDPLIESLNLQNNQLISLNINQTRRQLWLLDLSNNPQLASVSVISAPNLAVLKLNNINFIESLQVGRDSNSLMHVQITNSAIASNVISNLKFPQKPGILDLTGSVINLSVEDAEVISQLRVASWTVRGVD